MYQFIEDNQFQKLDPKNTTIKKKIKKICVKYGNHLIMKILLKNHL